MTTALPLLGGCGTSAVPKATLRVNLRLTAYERSFFKHAILPPFEEANNVRVEFTPGTTDEAIGALRGGSSRADLLAVDTEILGLLIAEGLTTDLNDERDGLRAAIIPSTLGALEANGALHALPYRPTTWITFYNRPQFAAAGVAPPRTWDELLMAAEAIRNADGSGQIALQGATTETIGGPAAQSFVELIWAFGGDPLTLTDDGSRAAADYLARLAQHLAPASRDAKFDTLTRDLATDRVALGPNWPVVATDLIQRGGKADIAVAPTIAGPASGARVLSGQVLLIPKNAARPDLARLFAGHLRTQATQATLARELAWFPLREDAFSAAPDWQQPVAAAALEALRGARALPPIANREAFDAALGTAFRQIAFEGVAPITALVTAANALRAVR
jgi:ABC-type glycerol-3-phosphate transport system substrate-binding protein